MFHIFPISPAPNSRGMPSFLPQGDTGAQAKIDRWRRLCNHRGMRRFLGRVPFSSGICAAPIVVSTAPMSDRPACGIFGDGDRSDGVMLPYGESSNGRMLHISEVVSGRDCGCKCPGCGALLVAKKGELRVHHFAHASGASCSGAFETAIHKLAKQVIAERGELLLPPIIAKCGGESRPVREAGRLVGLSVRLEPGMVGLRPDLIATKDERELLVEIAVTHFCDDAKKALIREQKLSCVEIDLQWMKRDATKAEIEEAILTSPRREWIYNRLQADAEAEMAAEQKLERQRQAKREAEQAARRADAAAREKRKRQDEAAGLVSAWWTLPANSHVIGATQAISDNLREMQDADLMSAVDVDIGGDGCFVVDRKSWQAAALHQLLSMDGLVIEVSEILGRMKAAGLLKNGLATFIGEDAAKRARTLDPAFRSPYEAVRELMDELCQAGLVSGHRGGRYSLSRTTADAARAATNKARENRRRLSEVRQAVWDILRDAGVGTKAEANTWMKTPLQTFRGTPEEICTRGDGRPLLTHLARIEAMLTGNGPVVEDLLGLPMEEIRERRRTTIEEEQRLAAEEARQRAEEERKKADEAARLLKSELIAYAKGELGHDEADAFLSEALRCLGGRSVEAIKGLNPSQADLVRDAVDLRRRKLVTKWGQERLTAKCREHLEMEAKNVLGEDFGVFWTKSRQPALGNRSPTDVAVDQDGLQQCLRLLSTAKAARRR